MLLAGAITGLAAGLVAQVAVNGGDHPTDYEWLIRAALVLPAVIFLLWWVLFPGIALEEPEAPLEPSIDASERLERIEATFDATAVPRARRAEVEPVGDASHSTYRSTIRRDGDSPAADPSSFGIRRPARGAGSQFPPAEAETGS